MRLLSEAPDRLVVEHRPVALAAGIGAGLALLGLAGVAETAGAPAQALAGTLILGAGFGIALERSRLTLDARDGLALVERIGVYTGERVARPLSALRRAELETTCDENGRPDCHRLVLRFEGGDLLPASRRFHAGPAPREAADAVNRWLRRNRWR
ncbi:MAG: hypothetical protein ACU0BS_07450 [Hasllibacter sp.]